MGITHPPDVQMTADMVEYLTDLAARTERSAGETAFRDDPVGRARLQGQAIGYREAAGLARIVADHIDAWYVHR